MLDSKHCKWPRENQFVFDVEISLKFRNRFLNSILLNTRKEHYQQPHHTNLMHIFSHWPAFTTKSYSLEKCYWTLGENRGRNSVDDWCRSEEGKRKKAKNKSRGNIQKNKQIIGESFRFYSALLLSLFLLLLECTHKRAECINNKRIKSRCNGKC